MLVLPQLFTLSIGFGNLFAKPTSTTSKVKCSTTATTVAAVTVSTKAASPLLPDSSARAPTISPASSKVTTSTSCSSSSGVPVLSSKASASATSSIRVTTSIHGASSSASSKVAGISQPASSAGLPSLSQARSSFSTSLVIPSSKAASSQSLNANGCPPYVPTTSTATKYTTLPGTTVLFNTMTYTTYLAIATSTSYLSYSYASTSTVYTATQTSTVTQTSSVIIGPSSTATVPTVAGFTPVLCLPAWQDSTVTTTKTEYSTVTTYLETTISFTTTVTAPTSVFTSSTTITTDFTSYTTLTVTTTSSKSSSTVYAACATNNVVSKSPSGDKLSIPQLSSGVDYRRVVAISPTDCCEQCQTDPTCVISSGVFADSSDGLMSCFIYYKTSSAANATVCDPRYVGATISKGSPIDFGSGSLTYISDSGCGQWA